MIFEIMNSSDAVISWFFTPAMLDKHGSCYGIQVLTHSRSASESFNGRISMKFHSQQIKGHCQYVPCLQGLLRFAQCLAIVLVKIWLVFCNPNIVKGQLPVIEMRGSDNLFPISL